MFKLNKNTKLKIAIIDDDKSFSQRVNSFLEKHFKAEISEFHCASSFNENANINELDIVIIENQIDDAKGIMKELLNVQQKLKVIILSIKNDVRTILQLLKEGVHDYVSKSDGELKKLRKSIEKVQSNLSQNKISIDFGTDNIGGLSNAISLALIASLQAFANTIYQHL